jgi:CheY-like chemotaxis protein
MSERTSPLHILLVEDNPADVRFTQEVLRDSQLPHDVQVARDGVEALAILRREGKHATALRPDVMLLDLNMPKKGGLELLREIQDDPGVDPIPCVILTVSDAEGDIDRSFLLQAYCYMTKPLDAERLRMVLEPILSA